MNSNNFSINFYNHLIKSHDHPQSMAVSPLSLLFCLGMFLKGCSGSTQVEIESLLQQDTKTVYSNLVKSYQRLRKVAVISNNIFINEDRLSGLRPEYCQSIQQLGVCDRLDVNQPHQEVQRINQWVEQQTRGLVKELVSLDSIHSDLVMILLNTIYFKSNWEHPFDPQNTLLNYTFKGRVTHKVDMMTQNQVTCPYYEDNECQVLELSYDNSSCGLIVVLPKRGYQLRSDFYDYADQMYDRKINILQFPKFKIEEEIDLIPILKSMGFHRMFLKADLGNMIQNPSGSEYVSSIKQKVVIVIDETGTEASAATEMDYDDECEDEEDENPQIISFIADRTFEYYIRDHTTGTILFIGRFD